MATRTSNSNPAPTTTPAIKAALFEFDEELLLDRGGGGARRGGGGDLW